MFWKSSSLAALFGFCWLISVTPAQDSKPSPVITKLGEHKLFDGKLIVKILEGDGKLSFSVAPGSTPKSPNITILPRKEGAFWLVYPESVNKVWFFRDPDLVEFESGENGVRSAISTGPGVLKNAPKAVLDALPKDVRERLKGK